MTVLVAACNAGSGRAPQASPAGTAEATPAPAVDVPATIEAVLTQVAPTPGPPVGVQPAPAADVAPVLLRTPVPAPAPSPVDRSLSDIVAGLESGLVQVITPDASGSGFAISNDGLILTNAHVVEDHEFVTVRSVRGWSYAGVVRGKDDDLDLAVVKIAALGEIQAMPLADASKIRPGDPVIALGFPLIDQFGDGYTVTTGIVSSIRRSAPAERFQTDAAINPGSSGGPLINSAGEVIGVNTVTFTEYAGISFAISIAEVTKRLEVLAAGRDVPALATADFEDYHNQACNYSFRVPSGWMVISEEAGCLISLGTYKDNDRVGVVNVWEYALNEGETLDDFAAWWSASLVERSGRWNSFTRISSERPIVERGGHFQNAYVIKYRWQETVDRCVSFATDRIMLSNHRPIALVFSASLCDFMPPSVIEQIADMRFAVWPPP